MFAILLLWILSLVIFSSQRMPMLITKWIYTCIIPTLRQREIKHKNDVGTEDHELIWLVTIDCAS